MDERNKKFAEMIVNYSCSVQPGERVLINEVGTTAKPLIKEIIRAVYKAGGHPFLGLSDASLNREIIMQCNEAQLEYMRDYQLEQMKGMDAYIAVRASDNTSELSDVPSEKLNMYNKILRPVLDERVNNTKWAIMRYPNNSMAQLAGMSTEAFEDFYYDVCTLDYAKMSAAMDPLVELMNKTDKVRLVAPGTDLTFSIRDIPAIKCDGKYNIPDGEVYTAPVKDSMNGVISYNTVSEEQGFTYDVEAELVEMPFDERVYEDLTMPAGVYEALRITIGEAEGHNWWCVMYPPLCIPAAESVRSDADQAEAYFDQGEYDLLTNPRRYRARLKCAEVFSRLWDRIRDSADEFEKST